MTCHRTNICSFAFGAALLSATALPAFAVSITPVPRYDLVAKSEVTPVAHRRTQARSVRHVTVRRHYVSGRHYYYRRRHASAFPAAAVGLFAGVLGAAIVNDYYDDGYYGYGYPAYSYGYPYSYGYATPSSRPRYYGTRNFYSGPIYRGGSGGGGLRFSGGQYHGGGGTGHRGGHR